MSIAGILTLGLLGPAAPAAIDPTPVTVATVNDPSLTPAQRSLISPNGNPYLPGTSGYTHFNTIVGGEEQENGANDTVNTSTAKGHSHGFFGSAVGDLGQGISDVENAPGDVLNAAGDVGEDAAKDALSGLFSGFESWLESNLERGALYAALIVGGLVLAGYGTVHLLEPSRTGAGGALKLTAGAA